MRKNTIDGQMYVQARQAAKILMGAYQRQPNKSWAAVGARFGMSKIRAYRIAHETLRPNPKKDRGLMRAVMRECDAKKRPATLRRLIRKFGVPFLVGRLKSRSRVYGHGGKHLSWED